jgi:hypothetical protein
MLDLLPLGIARWQMSEGSCHTICSRCLATIESYIAAGSPERMQEMHVCEAKLVNEFQPTNGESARWR